MPGPEHTKFLIALRRDPQSKSFRQNILHLVELIYNRQSLFTKLYDFTAQLIRKKDVGQFLQPILLVFDMK